MQEIDQVPPPMKYESNQVATLSFSQLIMQTQTNKQTNKQAIVCPCNVLRAA
jgi:hypothetical protein